MKISTTTLSDVFEIQPAIFHDDRGHFFESFNEALWASKGLPSKFVQDNQSFSKKNVVRGLHFQKAPFAQGKLVRVISGRVLDLALDLRTESPTFGKYELFELSGEKGNMVYIPEGFAHGFVTLEDTVFHYKCTGPYNKSAEAGILWNDPALNIPWRVESALVSDKDGVLPTFEQYISQSLQSV